MKKTFSLSVLLIFVSLLLFVSCGSSGGGNSTQTIASVTVEYNSAAKASSLTKKINLSSNIVTNEIFSTIYSETAGAGNITAMSFSNVKRITGSFSNNVDNYSLQRLTFDSSLQLLDQYSFYYARGLDRVKISSVPDIKELAFYNSGFRLDSDVDITSAQLKNIHDNFSNIMLGIKIKLVNGVGGADTSKSAYLNEKPSDVAVPSVSGYVFDGYYSAENGGEKIFDSNGAVVAGTVCTDSVGKWISLDVLTLYARYVSNYYTVKFQPGEEASGTMQDQIIGVGEGVELRKCTFDAPVGQTFKEWAVSGTNRKFRDMETVKDIAGKGEVITLVAVWEGGYTRTYYRNLNPTDDKIIGTIKLALLTTSTNISDPSYPGKTFVGWFLDRNGNTAFDPDESSNNDVSIYAKWEGITNYVIKFDPARDVVTDYRFGSSLVKNGYVYNINTDPDRLANDIYTSYVPLENLTVQTSEGKIRFSERPMEWRLGGDDAEKYPFLGWSVNKNASIATFPASSYSLRNGGVVPDFNGTPAFESGLMGNGAEITLYAVWNDPMERTSLAQQDVKLWMYVPSSGKGEAKWKNSGATYPESLKMYFAPITKIDGNIMGGALRSTDLLDTLKAANFYYVDDKGVSSYRLDGFYTAETGGYKVLNADGSFYNTEVLDKGMDNGFVYRNENDELVWIGGTINENGVEMNYTELYAHWELI